MKFLELEQGSEEWFEWREGKLTASVAAAVLDRGKYFPKNRKELADSLSGRRSTTQNKAMAHGTNMEPIAREKASETLGRDFKPICVQDGLYAASLDGWDDGWLLEVKCPMSGKDGEIWQSTYNGEIPDHYYWQMVQQIGLTDAEKAIFYVYVDGSHTYKYVDIEQAKEDWKNVLLPAWMAFVRDYDPEVPWNEKEGLEAELAASLYRSAKETLDAAKAEEAEARKRLLDLSEGQDMTIGGVSVTWYDRKGNVDYGQVPELEGVDLDDYRKGSTRQARINCAPH